MAIIRQALFILACAGVLVACAGGAAVKPDSKHRAEESIEGIYTVESGSEMIGRLALRGNQYIFTPTGGATIPPGLSDVLFFVKYPQGIYSMKYYGAVNQDTLLESLENLAILASVRFSSDQAGTPTDILTQATQYVFVIVSDKEERRLHFKPASAEIQKWFVRKPWD